MESVEIAMRPCPIEERENRSQTANKIRKGKSMKCMTRNWMLVLGALSAAMAASSATAQDLTIASFGGTYQDAQRAIYFEPFSQEAGIRIREESWDGGYGVLAAKMENPPADWDVVQVESAELLLGCADGFYETIDWDTLGGEGKYLEAAVNDCGVGTIVWSTALAFDADRVENEPTGWADFWDTENFPGKRSLRRGPRQNLEFALLADGVPVEEVYEVLSSPEGVDRAFAKLDEIKGDIVWWEAGAQPFQFLASGEVVMTTVWNGRLTGFNRTEGRNFKLLWPGSSYSVDYWVVLKNSPNKDVAFDFIRFASLPENQSKLPNYVAYGLTNLEAAELVDPQEVSELPTTPENLEGAFALDHQFWLDNVEELTERFNAWLAQ